MALLHRAQLTPSKPELIAAWLPTRAWIGGPVAEVPQVLGAYRFDDPGGEVGIETHLFGLPDGRIVQVPVTYRAAPLPGADRALVGTLHHSVLGQRWVYDGCADPVYVRAVVTAVLTGGTQAALEVATDEGLISREPDTTVTGSGTAGAAVPPLGEFECSDGETSTIVTGEGFELTLLRHVGAESDVAGVQTLRGRWDGAGDDVLLATVRVR